ncbi:sensor histidine kinase [Actinoplanes philippinensis]|nr:nitrate- and nitrite sensing domain-containing protein [Actinoplanes philippinensis]
MLALPLAAMLVLLAVIYGNEIGRYRTASGTEQRITVILALQNLVQELQNERGLTVAVLGGNSAFRGRIEPARARVDAERTAAQTALADGDLAADAARSLEEVDGLAAVRAGVDVGDADPDETFEFYTGLIEKLSDDTRHLEIIDDLDLRRGAESLEMLTEVKEATAQEWVFLDGVINNGKFAAGEFSELLNIVAFRDLALGEFDEFADESAAAAKTKLLGSAAAAKARLVERTALHAGDRQPLTANAGEWWAAVATMLDDMTGLGRQIGADTLSRAQKLREEATLRLGLLSGVVLLCLAGSAYLATAATRSLAEPLAALAGEADRLAGARLPEAVLRAAAGDDTGPPDPVPVTAGASAEVRRVADAFDRVQTTAYALATEQAQLRRAGAESLANLGRRNQNLLRRQLGFITRLEQEESSPTGLANLFELDHLATRMRRNAESLLVLVGAASPRQWSRPLPLTDVIRAAVSEVEEYRRVSLRRLDEAMVSGATASGLAHMLAELIENGLAFSPPDLDVELHGRVVDDGYLIAVCDQGVGMSEDELEVANRRLRGEGDFLTAPARFLGHYVVGRLAAEMGVGVQLARSPVTGVTARVTLPPEMLATPAPSLDRPAAPAEAAPGPAGADGTVRSTAVVAGVPAVPGPKPVELPSLQPPANRSRPLQVDYVVLDEQPAVPAPRLPAEAIPATAGHTVNGLRRRTPRSQRADRTEQFPRIPAEPTVPIADSPEAVRDRLTALRAGIQRGAGHGRLFQPESEPPSRPRHRDMSSVTEEIL